MKFGVENKATTNLSVNCFWASLLNSALSCLSIHLCTGTLLLAAAASEDSDTLWCVAQHSFSLHFPLMEAQVGWLPHTVITAHVVQFDVDVLPP